MASKIWAALNSAQTLVGIYFRCLKKITRDCSTSHNDKLLMETKRSWHFPTPSFSIVCKSMIWTGIQGKKKENWRLVRIIISFLEVLAFNTCFFKKKKEKNFEGSKGIGIATYKSLSRNQWARATASMHWFSQRDKQASLILKKKLRRKWCWR